MEFIKQLIILEGFMGNGVKTRDHRISLHRLAPVKINFDDFWKNVIDRNLKP